MAKKATKDKQIDYDDPNCNMFGLKPCPQCGSRYRWPTRPDHPKTPNMVVCDDCGRNEPYQGDYTND